MLLRLTRRSPVISFYVFLLSLGLKRTLKMVSGKIWISNSLRLDHTKPKASKSIVSYLDTHHTRSSSKLPREENITFFAS